jgi:hypothetical protein
MKLCEIDPKTFHDWAEKAWQEAPLDAPVELHVRGRGWALVCEGVPELFVEAVGC